MRVLFPSHPFELKKIDPAFETEHVAAKRAGIETHLLDAEALEARDYAKVVRRLPDIDEDKTAIYRGWMLPAASYAALHEALARRHFVLINSAAQYRHTHHLPESYPVIREVTPKTVWTTTGAVFDEPAVMELLVPFGDAPLIVKDYVKSQKHYWKEACFIPSARDREAVRRVTSKFIELQEDSLVGGLVFREFVAIEPLATHSKSGMPLTKEFRIFFLDGTPCLTAEYWDEGQYGEDRPPPDLFLEVAARVKSRFFTMDVARRTNGEWMIMELGDAQVAGLPERLDPTRFYEAIAATLRA